MKTLNRDHRDTLAGSVLRHLRTIIIVFFVVVLTVFSGGSPLAFGVGISTAHAASVKSTPTPNHANPKAGATSTLHAAPKPTYSYLPPAPTTPQAIKHTTPEPMQPATIALTPGKALQFTGSDGRLSLTIPAGAVTAADVSAAGGKLSLRVTQIAPASGSNAGGSGHVSFGTYQYQVLDAKGMLVTHGLRQALTTAFHYTSQEGALDIAHAFVVYNGARPQGTTSAPLPSGVKSVASTFGPSTTQPVTVDVTQRTLTIHPLIKTPSSSTSFNTDSSIAAFGKPDIFNADLNVGALTANETIDVPAGPGGLTPPVALNYSSESVTEQHAAQAAAGWVGEGWNMTGGAISWAQHNVTSNGSTPNWENSWQLSDPFGTSSELIPPAINVSTYYDSNLTDAYCATGNAASYPCPIQWHTANESHAKIYAYIGPLNIHMPVNPMCFRVYLPNGIMEEFGCTADSLQYYYSQGNGNYMSNWMLDLITDPQGNQIHYTYQSDTQTIVYMGTNNSYPRDTELATISYDSPSCHSATTMCTGSAWAPLAQVTFNASNTPFRRTNSIIATASSSVESYGWSVNNAIDGSFNTTSTSMGWTSNNSLTTNHTESYQLDLGASQTISDIDLSPRNDGANTGYGFPIDFTIATSANGTTWTTDVTKTGYALPASGDVQRFTFTAQTARYIKITGTNLRSNPNDAGNYRMQLAEVEAYSSADLVLTATPTASSSVEGYGWSVNNAKDGSRLTNGTTSNGWTSINSLTTNHTEWYQLDLGSSKAFNEVELYPRTDGSNAGFGFPNDFTIATSPDGTTWTTVVTQTSSVFPSSGVGQRYSFPAQTARYIRVTGTNLRSNPYDSGNYRMQFAEVEVHNSTDIALSPLANCNTGAALRCDDPFDLSGSFGLAAPEEQSTYVLNDIQVQTRATGTGAWNTLRDYQLSYEQSSPTTSTDPVTGLVESVAGMLDLTQFQEVGDDVAMTTLPAHTFGYSTQINTYQDDTYAPVPVTNCGPASWNTGNGSGCLLWGQSNANNSRYLSTSSNGLGMTQTFSWVDARNNTHGVPGGGSNTANPLYCNTHQSGYPCNEADDQNWSHIVLNQGTDTVVRVTQSGQGGTQTTTPITSTTAYAYFLSYPLLAQECGDCTAGMYWGNQNDGDYLDYYNGIFMGFTQTNVANPDGSTAVHKYYATEGYGLYDTGQVTCYATSPCHNDPWWDLGNAAHGHEYETDSYDTNGTSLLKKATATYTATCPPSGVSGSPSVTVNGQTFTWDGHLVSEHNHNNPVAVCDVQQTQSSTTTLNGTSNSVTATQAMTYDSYGRVTQTITTSNSGSPSTIVANTSYIWNDGLNVPAQIRSNTPQTISGTYLIDVPAYTDTEDGSGTHAACTHTSYDGQSYATGQTSALTLGEATTKDSYSNCGNSGNGYTPSGDVRTTTVYDAYGNTIATDDADANGGVSGHTGCTVNSTTYTSCTTFDATYATLLSGAANALNQMGSTSYGGSSTASGGFGLWPLSTTDPDGQTTSVAYDPLGRMTSETKPGETMGLTTTSWGYTTWCSGTAAQGPCAEVDETDRLNSTTTVMKRAFYDGHGNLIETRQAAPSGQDVVQYALYDIMSHQVFLSQNYFVTAYTGAAGAAAYSLPDSTKVGTTTTYDGLDRMLTTTDPLSAVTSSNYTVVCAPAGTGDSGCFATTNVTDANSHKQTSYVDGMGHALYAQDWTGTSGSGYTLYRTTKAHYDVLGDTTSMTYADGTHQVTATYDALKRQTAFTDPDLGSYTLSYDPNGNLTSSADPRGASGTVYLGYDGLNRNTWKSTNSNGISPLFTATYDSTASGNQGKGRLTSETFASGPSQSVTGSYVYVYDARGQQTGWTETLGATSYPFTTSYNDAGQATSLTYPDGDAVTTSYGAQDWLSGVTETKGGTTNTLLNTLSYTGANGASMLPTSAGVDNGVYTWNLNYDIDLRLKETKVIQASNSSTLFDQARGFDAVGNVTSTATTLPAGTDNQVFCYDTQNRLVWAGSQGTPSCGGTLTPGTLNTGNVRYTQTYAYDTLNRLTTGPKGNGYTYGDTNHLDALTAAPSYTASYDAVGDMTGRSGQILGYNALRQLITWQNQATSPTQTASYAYNDKGERVQQVVTVSGTTTTTSYIGGYEEVSVTGSTTTTTKYYNAGLVKVVNVNGTLSYLVNDDLGSISEALSAGGGVQATELYTPYGSMRYSSGAMPTSYGYTKQQQDPSGLNYDHARYYDASVGQFISADGKQGPNRYGYVAGNPETNTDPTGNAIYGGGGRCPDGYCQPSHNPTPGGHGCTTNCGSGGNGCTKNCNNGSSGNNQPPVVTSGVAGGVPDVDTALSIVVGDTYTIVIRKVENHGGGWHFNVQIYSYHKEGHLAVIDPLNNFHIYFVLATDGLAAWFASDNRTGVTALTEEDPGLDGVIASNSAAWTFMAFLSDMVKTDERATVGLYADDFHDVLAANFLDLYQRNDSHQPAGQPSTYLGLQPSEWAIVIGVSLAIAASGGASGGAGDGSGEGGGSIIGGSGGCPVTICEEKSSTIESY